MTAKKHHPFIFLINIILFFTVIIFSGNDIIDISIKNATPFLPLPLLCAFSIFASVESAVIAGLLTGIMLDSVSVGSYCFNAIIFLILGAFVSLAANTLFNKNIRAALALAVIVCFFYFTVYWITFAAIGVGIENSLIYLLEYAVPSALYSAVFIIPFYFLYRHFDKLKN